jgi:methylphosphotriester-DNA--protein-cysteine methyltransferase
VAAKCCRSETAEPNPACTATASMDASPPSSRRCASATRQQPVAPSARGDRLAPLLQWLGEHLHETHTLLALAERAVMSPRTFTRRFRQATGTTVGQWLQNSTADWVAAVQAGQPVAKDNVYASNLRARQAAQ